MKSMKGFFFLSLNIESEFEGVYMELEDNGEFIYSEDNGEFLYGVNGGLNPEPFW